LDATLTRDLVSVLYKYNCPHVPPGRFVSDLDTPNAEAVLGHAEVIHGLGGDVDIDHLRTIAGLPKPRPTSDVASPVQSLSPVAVGQTPQGVPVAGVGGPQQQAVPSEVVAQQQQVTPSQSPVSSQSILDA
jgi:hypothetical protein